MAAHGSSKESLSKTAALLLTSGMMVGTGIFTTLGAATAEAQSGILISMIIGGIIVLLTGLSAAQAGVNYPEEGGAFIWMRIFGYPTISFAAGISYLIKGIVGLSIASLGFAHYSAQLFPGLSIPITASVVLLVVAAVNFFGITPTAKVIISIFFINLILLSLYVGFAVPSVKVKNYTAITGTGITGILSGAAAFFWAWDGFQRTAIMANQIKNPRKSIPLAIVGGISIAAIVYLIVAGTTLGVLGPKAMGKSDIPLFLGAKKAVGWGSWMIVLSAWILAFSDILGDLMSTSKVCHSMGQEHELPHLLGTVHKRLKSPQYAILLLTIIGLIMINTVTLRKLVTVASTCTLLWYIATNISALKLNTEQRFTWPIISWVGIGACIALLFSLPLWSVAGAVSFIAILTGIRWLLKRELEKSVEVTGGNWTVSGLKLEEGDIISVTAQYAGETVSTVVTSIVDAAPHQTREPLISGTVTAADTIVIGKAPTGASVVVSINGIAQTAVIANGGNWAVPGLTLAHKDLISVTAQSPGETMSKAVTTVVSEAPIENSEPVILGTVTAEDKDVSGKAPTGTTVVLSINGKAEPPVVATDGKWTVPNLNLSQGDTISITAQYGGETVNIATTRTVAPKPLQTAEPIISGIVTAADTMVTGKAPVGAKVVLSVNGAVQKTIIAALENMKLFGLNLEKSKLSSLNAEYACEIVNSEANMTLAPEPPQTAEPIISGIVTAVDTTVSGKAVAGATVVVRVNGVIKTTTSAIGGNWMVTGLTLGEGDSISATAQRNGEKVSNTITRLVTSAPAQTAAPIISAIVTAADTTVSGTSASDSSIILSINGTVKPAVVAVGGGWIVSGLTLAKDDLISVTAQSAGEKVSLATTTKVQ